MEIAKKNNESGLTMIELIVAIGIFGLVISIVVGIFILAVVNQRRIVTVRNVNDNVRFTIEVMSREIRTGKNFSSGVGQLSFVNANEENILYRLANGIIEKSSDAGNIYLSMTGPEVTITYLNFYLSGQTALDGLQPRVTVAIGADSKIGNQSTSLKIQTTVGSRLIQN